MINQTKATKVSDLFTNASSSDKKHTPANKINNFSDFMSKSLSTTGKKLSSTIDTSKVLSSNSKDKIIPNNKIEIKDRTNEVNKDIKDNESKNVNTIKDQTNKVNDLDKHEAVTDCNYQNLENKVKDVVKSILELSDEELSDLMSKLGLQWIDLLNPDKLKELLLETNRTDITQLLTDESLVETMNLLTEAVSTIDLEEFSISLEQLTKSLEDSQLELGLSEKTSELTDGENEDIILLNKYLNPRDSERINQESDEKIPFIQVEKSKESTQSNVLDGLTNLSETPITSNLSAESYSNKDNNQNANIDNTNAINTMINNLAGVSNSAEDFSDLLANVREMREIVTQIVEQIKVTIKPEITNMEMNLNPESLGRVNLSITSQKGIMTAQFIVESEAAREAIQSQLHNLKETFSQQNLIVDAVEVTVSNFAFSQSNQASDKEAKRENGKRKLDLDELNSIEDDLAMELELAQDVKARSGNLVDYTA